MKPPPPSFTGLQILNSQPSDLGVIFRLFNQAIAYQKKNGYDLWPQFSEALIQTELAEKRHWKIVEGADTVCIFSVVYSDPIIWGPESDQEPAVYLHRIAINPSFKGRGMMPVIRDWALEHARQSGRKYVRMDTWGHNAQLRNYYITCGFKYLGQRNLPEVEGQPAHYGGSVLSLFQLEV